MQLSFIITRKGNNPILPKKFQKYIDNYLCDIYYKHRRYSMCILEKKGYYGYRLCRVFKDF